MICYTFLTCVAALVQGFQCERFLLWAVEFLIFSMGYLHKISHQYPHKKFNQLQSFPKMSKIKILFLFSNLKKIVFLKLKFLSDFYLEDVKISFAGIELYSKLLQTIKTPFRKSITQWNKLPTMLFPKEYKCH